MVYKDRLGGFLELETVQCEGSLVYTDPITKPSVLPFPVTAQVLTKLPGKPLREYLGPVQLVISLEDLKRWLEFQEETVAEAWEGSEQNAWWGSLFCLLFYPDISVCGDLILLFTLLLLFLTLLQHA